MTCQDAITKLKETIQSCKRDMQQEGVRTQELSRKTSTPSTSDDNDTVSAPTTTDMTDLTQIHPHMTALSKLISHHMALLTVAVVTANDARETASCCVRLGEYARRLVSVVMVSTPETVGVTLMRVLRSRVFAVFDQLVCAIDCMCGAGGDGQCGLTPQSAAGTVLSMCQSLDSMPLTNAAVVSVNLNACTEQLNDAVGEMQDALESGPSALNDECWDELLDSDDDDGSHRGGDDDDDGGDGAPPAWTDKEITWIRTATTMIKTVQLSVKKLASILTKLHAAVTAADASTDATTPMPASVNYAMDDLAVKADACVIAADNLVGELSPPLDHHQNRLDDAVSTLARAERDLLHAAQPVIDYVTRHGNATAHVSSSSSSSSWTDLCLDQITTLTRKLAL